jgi:hypothetical protein
MFVDCRGTILSRSENCGAANVRADTADEPQRHTQRMTVEDLRKSADSCRDLEDPTLISDHSNIVMRALISVLLVVGFVVTYWWLIRIMAGDDRGVYGEYPPAAT